MAKIGDTVRFLSSTGGGKITRIEGQVAYVDEDGFETPVLIRELVVVMPAGHEGEQNGAKKMFDQSAYDKGRKQTVTPEPVQPPAAGKPGFLSEPEIPVEETPHGDRATIALAFDPDDVRSLDKATFTVTLVNDSNYWLSFCMLRRGDGDHGWTMVYEGTVAPNELIDISKLTHSDLPGFEKIAFQCVAFKKGGEFSLQAPVSISRKLDLTKFHKFHCFRPGVYFDSPVLELPLVTNGVAVHALEINADEIQESLSGNKKKRDVKSLKSELSTKYRVDTGRKSKREAEENPHKLLPLIEIDLHIGELTDTISGMEAKDMLELQLETVRKTMKANQRRIGQKIVFIHGKGEGVLRKAVLDLMRKEFPKAELQDASFREYGFGATLVTIH